MLSLLRTRRWLGFTLVVIVAIVGFGLLSRWQWMRAEENRQERIALAAALAQEAVDVNTLPDGPPPWTPVTVTGSYLPDLQVAVRKRPLNTINGFWVMTPLVTAEGRTVWVNRGWTPVSGDALATPPLPSPPPGSVTVEGLVRPFEDGAAGDNDGLPPGQVASPSVATLPDVADPLGYVVQLRDSDPEQGDLTVLPLPEVEMDEGRNISYAVQWLLFALVAVGGWYVFLLREAREDAEKANAGRRPHDGTDPEKEPAWTSD